MSDDKHEHSKEASPKRYQDACLPAHKIPGQATQEPQKTSRREEQEDRGPGS